MGVGLERQNRNRAMSGYGKALRIRPDYEDAAVNLARALTQSGRLQDAVEVYKSVLTANPSAMRAAYNLAVELDRSGEIVEALEVYRRVWRSRSDAGVFSRFRMGSLFAASGKRDSARSALKEFREVWKGEPKVLQSAERLLDQLR